MGRGGGEGGVNLLNFSLNGLLQICYNRTYSDYADQTGNFMSYKFVNIITGYGKTYSHFISSICFFVVLTNLT